MRKNNNINANAILKEGFLRGTFGSHRAQLKIQQMAFMLVAVIIFFVLTGLFFLSILNANLHKQATVLEKEQAIETARKLAETAEFTCGKPYPYCIDAEKVLALANKKSYKGFWPVLSIEIKKISLGKKQILCDINNYPSCNTYRIYEKSSGSSKSKRAVSSFVSLCRKEFASGIFYDKCELAKIIVEFEKK